MSRRGRECHSSDAAADRIQRAGRYRDGHFRGMSPPDVNVGELEDGDLRLEFVGFAPHPVHKVPAYRFRMLNSQTGEELGNINLRVGSTRHIQLYAGHLGYSFHPPHRGHRYAARSVRLLMSLARQLQFEALWITYDPEN